MHGNDRDLVSVVTEIIVGGTRCRKAFNDWFRINVWFEIDIGIPAVNQYRRLKPTQRIARPISKTTFITHHGETQKVHKERH